jgi:hypothetical protein
MLLLLLKQTIIINNNNNLYIVIVSLQGGQSLFCFMGIQQSPNNRWSKRWPLFFSFAA